jgi:hypothetical protein
MPRIEDCSLACRVYRVSDDDSGWDELNKDAGFEGHSGESGQSRSLWRCVALTRFLCVSLTLSGSL